MTKQRRTGILLGLLLFAVLSVIALACEGPSVQDDLTEKTLENLTDDGLGGLAVDFDGRDATVSGTVPAGSNITNRDQLEDFIRSESGVRTVDVEQVNFGAPVPTATAVPQPTATQVPATAVPPTAVPPTAVPAAAVPVAYNLATATSDGASIVLEGEVLNEGNRQTLVDAANAEYGEANVTDNLTVRSGDFEPGDGADARIGELAALIPLTRTNLTEGQAKLEDQALSVTGTAVSADGKEQVESARDASGLAGSANLEIVAPTFDLTGVEFDSGTANLTAESTVILDEAVATLQDRTDVNVEVAGHTDDQGGDESNQALSQARAEAVQAYLTNGGVAADRLTATGYGESQPIASNDTDEGRQANRRVELVVQEGN